MHKLADVIAFLFLSTLISFTGFLFIEIHAQFSNTPPDVRLDTTNPLSGAPELLPLIGEYPTPGTASGIGIRFHQHYMYVAVTDKTGRIKKKSSPLAFVVNEAQAVTVTNFLGDQPIEATEESNPFSRYYLVAGLLVIIIGLIGVFIIIRSRRSKHTHEASAI